MSRRLKRQKYHKETRIILLGAGGILHLSVVRALAAAGWMHIHEFVVNPVPVPMSIHSRYLSSSIVSDKDYQNLAAEALIAEYSAWDRTVLLPVSEKAVEWCNRHRHELEAHFRIPRLPDPTTLTGVMDKWELHNWLQAQGFPSPRTVLFNPAETGWQKKVESLNFPLIMKSKLEVPFKLIQNIVSSRELVEIEPKLKNRPKDNLLQEQIEGVDCDCSVLADNGEVVAFTMQSALVNENLRYGTTIKLYHDEQLLDEVKKIIRRLQWSGVAHMDFRYHSESRAYYLIDFNPRYWATLLGSVCAGVNMASLQVERALGIISDTGDMKKNSIYFMMNRDGIKELYKRFFKRSERLDQFQFRNSELWFALQDPMPELRRRMRGTRSGFRRAA